MAFPAHVLNVFIASPGDTSEYRDAVEAALHRWNGMRSMNAGVILLPRRWEVDGVPMMGGDGQSQLNIQLVDTADIVIGIFHTRLGRPTPRSKSGTAEEIERTHAAGKPVHVYRSMAPLPPDVDTTQIEVLRAFFDEMQKDSLTGSFTTAEDLQDQVHAAIELDLTNLGLGGPAMPPARAPQAVMRAEYLSEQRPEMDSKGRVKYRTRRQRIRVTNQGTATAKDVHVTLDSLDGRDLPKLHNDDVHPDLIPGGHYDYPMFLAMGMTSALTVSMTWRDDDDVDHSVTQSVSLFG